MAEGDARKREKAAGPWKPQRATRWPRAQGYGPHCWTKSSTDRPPWPPSPGYTGQLFRHRRHRPACTDHPGPPPSLPPHLPLWRCEPAAPAPISSYCWTGAPAAPPRMLSTAEKEKGSVSVRSRQVPRYQGAHRWQAGPRHQPHTNRGSRGLTAAEGAAWKCVL